MNISPEVRVGAELTLGLVLLLSAIPKALKPARFVEGLRRYQILPTVLVVPAAFAVTAIQLILGAAFLFGTTSSPILWSATLLLGTFFLASVRTLALGRGVPCACFGYSEQLSSWTLIRLLILMVGIGAIALAPPLAPEADLLVRLGYRLGLLPFAFFASIVGGWIGVASEARELARLWKGVASQ
jgi:hypothetical protein